MKFDKDPDAFLQPTRYCDCDHPTIGQLAHDVVSSHVSEKEKAEALFYWVKENVRFEFGPWGVKTSEVLKTRGGMCTTKANLLVALLRAAKIPAGYVILKVNTKEFYRELMCPSFGKLVSPHTTHVCVGVVLDGDWLLCDPSVDNELNKALRKTTPFAEMTGFNISEKEIETIEGILTKTEFLANIDEDLDKLPKNSKGTTLEVLNSYLEFLRESRDLETLSACQMEENFLDWLSKRNSPYFPIMKQLSS